MTHKTPTRAEVEALLRDNGFSPGASHDDPGKDARHVWTRGGQFVMLSLAEGPDANTVVFGDADEAEPGASLSYEELCSVLAGEMTTAAAVKERFRRTGVFAELGAARSDIFGRLDEGGKPDTSRARPKRLPKGRGHI